MKKLRLNKPHRSPAGAVIGLPDRDAERLAKDGVGEIVRDSKRKAVKSGPEETR